MAFRAPVWQERPEFPSLRGGGSGGRLCWVGQVGTESRERWQHLTRSEQGAFRFKQPGACSRRSPAPKGAAAGGSGTSPSSSDSRSRAGLRLTARRFLQRGFHPLQGYIFFTFFFAKL